MSKNKLYPKIDPKYFKDKKDCFKSVKEEKVFPYIKFKDLNNDETDNGNKPLTAIEFGFGFCF